MNQDSLCRVCVSSDVACVLVDIFEKHGSQDCISDILFELAGIKVAVSDGFPQKCCFQCRTDLVQAISVRRKCIESEKLLRTSNESSLFLTDDQSDKVFDNLSTVSSDYEDTATEKNLPLYHCGECSSDFFNSDTLQEHYESNHANAIYGWESFGINEFSLFDSTDDDEDTEKLMNHLPTARNIIQNNPAYRCCGCKSVFDTVSELQQHSQIAHTLNANTANDDKPFQCNVCYHTFTTKHRMKEHQTMKWFLHYQCAICGLLFGRHTQCIAHERIHIDLKKSCNVCGKEFSNDKYLHRHKKMMHANLGSRKKYICKVCGARVLSTSYLKAHMRLHSEGNPHTCNVCGARFKVARYLKWHIAKHKAIYTCKQCGQSCQGYSLLQQHMNSHPESRKYGCTICPARFRLKQNLNKHLRNVHSVN